MTLAHIVSSNLKKGNQRGCGIPELSHDFHFIFTLSAGQNQDSTRTDRGVAVPRRRTLRNVRPCDLHDCMWPKASDGNVYIPYVIADHYCKYLPVLLCALL